MTISTAVDPSAVASVLGIQTLFRNFGGGAAVQLPSIGAVVGQGTDAATYTTDPFQATSSVEVGNATGFGGPLHLAALELFPANGDGVGSIPHWFFPLQADGSGVAEVQTITPSGTGTATAVVYARIGGIRSQAIVIPAASTPAEVSALIVPAVNAVLEIPVIAADITTAAELTLKWSGASGASLTVEIEGELQGNLFAVATTTPGAVNPSVQPALDQFGDVWYTMVLNLGDADDADALDELSTFGEGRWGALSHNPFVAFVGSTEATVATAIAVSDARRTDRVNAQLVAPGSPDLPLRVAARQFARIIKLANANPAHDYVGQVASGLLPGSVADQWRLYAQRDQAVKGGSGTSIVVDSQVKTVDVVTFYHPTGDPLPAYQWVVNVVKLQNTLFNLRLEFVKPEWQGAPLIADADATVNPAAKQPKAARAAATSVVQGLGLNAVLADVANTIPLIQAELGANPRRLELVVPVKLSGNTGIISVDLQFGFNVAQAA